MTEYKEEVGGSLAIALNTVPSFEIGGNAAVDVNGNAANNLEQTKIRYRYQEERVIFDTSAGG